MVRVEPAATLPSGEMFHAGMAVGARIRGLRRRTGARRCGDERRVRGRRHPARGPCPLLVRPCLYPPPRRLGRRRGRLRERLQPRADHPARTHGPVLLARPARNEGGQQRPARPARAAALGRLLGRARLQQSGGGIVGHPVARRRAALTRTRASRSSTAAVSTSRAPTRSMRPSIASSTRSPQTNPSSCSRTTPTRTSPTTLTESRASPPS